MKRCTVWCRRLSGARNVIGLALASHPKNVISISDPSFALREYAFSRVQNHPRLSLPGTPAAIQ